MKRGQGLPISVIVIAALALLVLVILFSVFTGRMTIFTRTVTECRGECVPASLCEVPARDGRCAESLVTVIKAETVRLSQSGEKTICCLIAKA